MSFLKNVFTSNQSRPSTQPSSTKTSIPSSPQSAIATFQNSWLTIKNALSSPAHRHDLLESTSIKNRLDVMWECLAVENHIPVSASNPTGTGSLTSTHTGECVEYFLKNDVPGTLVALSLPDQPVGVKGLVIGFFLSLVVFMDEHFVVHSKVHKPLVRLLRSCVEPELDTEDGDDAGWRTKESLYEEAVVEVMCHLCSRIKTFPELLAVFLHNRSRTTSQVGDQLSWPPSPKIQSASVSSSVSQSPTPHPVSNQPSQRKSVHFSPQTRPLSPSPSLLSAGGSAADSLIHNTMGSSVSSSNPSSTVDAHTTASRISTSPSLESPKPTLRADSDMLIFSYLLRFIHREGRTGDLARAGLLFLMELAMGRTSSVATASYQQFDGTVHRLAAASNKAAESASIAFGEWILDCDFADVLGAGLGAAYGLLPSRLVITPRNALDQDANGGMVLGGMGTHLNDGPIDEGITAEEREREQRRARLLIGLGVSGSEEFRSQMDLFLKLIEFTQDVLRNTTSSPLHHYVSLPDPPTPIAWTTPAKPTLLGATAQNESSSPELPDEVNNGPTPSEIVASAISSSILTSIRKLFLNAIMYPSVLECSEQDGSAVAVMSYLEAMLSLLETDGELADCVLRFLMTEDDAELDPMPLTGNTSQPYPHREASIRRRKSGAIQIIEAEFNKAQPHRRHHPSANGLTSMSATGITYYNSLGRFTLKDLLINNIRSLDGATATAALKLLHVIAIRHDRYALALLDIQPDPRATAFPFPNDFDNLLHDAEAEVPDRLPISGPTIPHLIEDDDDDELEEFTYPVITPDIGDDVKNEDAMFVYPTIPKHDDDPEEFTYPISERQTSTPTPESRSRRILSHSMSTPATPHFLKPALELADRMQRSPCPTYQTHRDALDYLTSLIQLIEPLNTVMKPDASHNPMSTAFGHYLLDAEAELTGTATFRRGLLSDCVSASLARTSNDLNTHPPQPHQASIHTPVSKLDSDMSLIDYPVIRHRISADGLLMSSVLESLTRFFTQSPELNLILTGCVASLASCPTRSLEGWLLPFLPCVETKDGEGPNSVWMSESSKLDLDQNEGDDRSIDFAVDEFATSISDESRLRSAWTRREDFGDSVLEIYRQLAEQVADYRRTIKDFDRYLSERRQGLVFVENLEDALDGDASPFAAVEDNQSLVELSAAPVKAADAPSSTKVVSEPKPKSKETSFFASLFRPNTTSNTNSKTSPPNNHAPNHRHKPSLQTPDRTISFQPFSEHYRQTGSIKLTVTPAETPGSLKKYKNVDEDWSSSDYEPTGGPETPTKKTKNGVTVEDVQKGDTGKGRMMTLSMVLDNVVVLQEALKEIGAIVSARKSLGIDPVRFF